VISDPGLKWGEWESALVRGFWWERESGCLGHRWRGKGFGRTGNPYSREGVRAKMIDPRGLRKK